MNFEKSLHYLLADLSAIQRVELENGLKNANIHSGQIFILFELWNKDHLSQVEIATNLNLSPPTINKLVKGLKETGFVEMNRSESDARVVIVSLTEKGKMIRPEIEIVWLNLETKFTGNLTETEKLIFLQLLEKVLQNFYND